MHYSSSTKISSCIPLSKVSCFFTSCWYLFLNFSYSFLAALLADSDLANTESSMSKFNCVPIHKYYNQLHVYTFTYMRFVYLTYYISVLTKHYMYPMHSLKIAVTECIQRWLRIPLFLLLPRSSSRDLCLLISCSTTAMHVEPI